MCHLLLGNSLVSVQQEGVSFSYLVFHSPNMMTMNMMTMYHPLLGQSFVSVPQEVALFWYVVYCQPYLMMMVVA